jgi:hypothetical protein
MVLQGAKRFNAQVRTLFSQPSSEIGRISSRLEHFHSRCIVDSAMAEPSSRVVRGDARESLGKRLFQRLGSSGLERA